MSICSRGMDENEWARSCGLVSFRKIDAKASYNILAVHGS